MVRWTSQAGLVALIGIVAVGGTACGSGDESRTRTRSSTAPAPMVNMGIPERDMDPALAIVEREFRGCLSLGIDVMGSSTVFPPSFAEKMVRRSGRTHLTGQAVRPSYNPLVVALREGEMFLVELDPGGRKGAAPFNDAAEEMLQAASGAGDDCGSIATTRYAFRGTPQSP